MDVTSLWPAELGPLLANRKLHAATGSNGDGGWRKDQKRRKKRAEQKQEGRADGKVCKAGMEKAKE